MKSRRIAWGRTVLGPAVWIFAALFSLPVGLGAQTWSWTEDFIELTGGDSVALALDQEGNLHASYHVPEGGLLKYAFRPAGSSEWFKMTLDHGLNGFSSGITIDAQGNPHICATPTQLKYFRFDGHKWFSQWIDPDNGMVGFMCSILVTPDGKPMVSWYLPMGGFRYAILRDGVWMATGLDGNMNDYPGKWNSMVLDADGNPHIAYSDFPFGQLRYARFDGKGWIRSVIHSQNDDPGGPKGMGASILLDAHGNPWISYYDEQSLRVAHYAAGKWTKQTVEKLPPFNNWGWKQFHSNIALDHHGNPHIVFESLQGLEHAWWDGKEWRIQIVLAQSVISFYENTMVMDKNDVIYIAYRDPLEGSLKLATGRPPRASQTASNPEKPAQEPK